MTPLAFLFARTFANGVRRALTSPRRTVSLVFFAFYYYWILMRPFTPERPTNPFPGVQPQLSMPSAYTVDGAVFVLMAIASMFMIGGVLTYRGGFRPADVDVLFPTPVSPKSVLLFRMARDYLVTLIMPILFGILGYRGTKIGFQTLIQHYPTHGADMMRMTWIAWMLLSLCWVSIGYAASLFVGRSDLRSDRNRAVITYGLAIMVVVIAVTVGWRLHQKLSFQTALEISHWWLLRIVLLPATAAAAVASGGIEGNWLSFGLGIAGLLTLIAGAFAAAFSQVQWLYDQAAARGFDSINLRKLRRGGNQYALAAEMARRGRVRRRWLDSRFDRMTATGPLALIWKEQVLQIRALVGTGLLLGIICLGAIGSCAWFAADNPSDLMGALLGAVMCFFSYLYSLSIGFAGFQEMLRKVDLLKPLPFTPGKTLFCELVGKAPIPGLTLLLGGLLACCIAPALAQACLAGVLVSVATLIEITGAILFTVTMFPDYDDPTQRGLSMILMLLCILICSSPGLGAYFGLVLLLHASPLVAAIPAVAIELAIAAGLATVAGSIYAGFNPAE